MRKNLAAGPIVAAGIAAFGIAASAHAAGETIQIVFASYGYGADRADVKDAVVKYCDAKASCKFLVKNENLGKPDPSPGNDKGLMIAWKCGAVDHKEQFAEGKSASLDCN